MNYSNNWLKKNLFIILVLMVSGCAKHEVTLVNKRQPDIFINSDIKTIIIHNDLIDGREDKLGVKKMFLKHLSASLSESGRFKILHYTERQEVNPGVNFKGAILCGRIKSVRGLVDGEIKRIKRLDYEDKNSSGEVSAVYDYDIIENDIWKNKQLVITLSLSLIEVSEKPINIAQTFSLVSLRNFSLAKQTDSSNSYLTQVELFKEGEYKKNIASDGKNRNLNRKEMVEELVKNYLKKLIPTNSVFNVVLDGADQKIQDYFLTAQYERARFELKDLLKLAIDDTKKAELNYLMGLTWEASAKDTDYYLQARENYLKAIELNPQLKSAYLGLGRVEKNLAKRGEHLKSEFDRKMSAKIQ